MIHSVSKEMITVIQCVPRIAERTTPAIAAQLKVCSCFAPISSKPLCSIGQFLTCRVLMLCVAVLRYCAATIFSDLLLSC